jgi:hypothetical protein
MKEKKQFPKTFFDITIGDFLYMKNVEETYKGQENKITTELVKYFTGGADLPLLEAKMELNKLAILMQAEPRFIQRFEHKGVEYGMIPNLERMSTGEYSDIELYSKDLDKICNLMAIMYRPITENVKDMYRIEPYESSHKYSQIMRDVPVEVYLGMMVFFYDLSKSLLQGSLTYSQKVLQAQKTL